MVMIFSCLEWDSILQKALIKGIVLKELFSDEKLQKG